MRVNRNESELTPYYKQIKDKIMEDIESGKLRHGDKLPSERALAEQFNISRMTARHTLSILEREGVVERRAGSGTFISNKKIELDFITFNSFTKTMEGKGYTPSTEILSIRFEEANPLLSNKLKVERGETLITMKRLRYVNQIPVSIEESFIPYKFCKGLENKITNASSLYRTLEDEYGIVLVKAKEYMQVGFSDDQESKLLKIRSESPCILLEAVAFDKHDCEIEFSKSITRSDMVKYYSELNLK